MKVVALIILIVLALIALMLFVYLIIGAIFFRSVLGKKSIKKYEKRHKKSDFPFFSSNEGSEIRIDSDGITLVGHYFHNNSKKTVILVHGYEGNYKDMNLYAQFFYNRGFNVLCVENRAHGQSGGEYIGMGYLDRLDILKWINFLNEKEMCDIVLFGISMGAVAVCSACGENLPSNVKCAIADSPFDNTISQFSYVGHKYGFVGICFTKIFVSYAKRVKKIDLQEFDANKFVKNTKIPILYIHGAEDNYVCPESAKKLFEETPPTCREYYLISGAKHIKGYEVAGAEYEREINKFFQKHHIF